MPADSYLSPQNRAEQTRVGSRVQRNALVLVAAATVVRLILAAVVPLFPDETYYWEWSRRIAAGYFDHPPAVAFLIRAGTTLFGATSIGVRAGVVLAGAIASWSIVILAGRLAVFEPVSEPVLQGGVTGGSGVLGNAGSRAALLVSVIPVALVGFVLATPDAPLLASIALTLVALERAIAAPPRSRDTLGWWIAAGIALGLAFCSKYTAVLVPMGVLVGFLVRPSLRARLTEPGPYVATVFALLVLAPNLLWNAHHGWISFAFQLQHGLGAPRGSALTRELNLIGGQLGLISPIIAVMAAIAVARCLRGSRDDRRFMLATVATAVIVFFMLSALRKPVEANWPAPALLAALPLLAVWDVRGTARKWLIAGCALAAVSTLVVAVHAATGVLRLPVRRDPIAKAHGWDDLALAVTLAVTRAGATLPASGCSTTLLAADRYQDASELAYHLPGHPRVFALNLGGRRNQYDLWPSLRSAAQPDDCVLFVVDAGPAGNAVVQKIHAISAAPVSTAALRWDGRTVARRAIWLLRGVPSAPPAAVVLSPLARAGADSAARVFAARSAAIDSAVRSFRRGPSPYLVPAAESGPPVSNSDRRAAIAVRVNELHQMLMRAGATAVYRDARYPECTFVRTRMIAGTEIGYVHTPEGCKLAGGNGDQRLVLSRALIPARNDWYVYAAPAPGEIVQ